MKEETFKTVSNLLAVMPSQVPWDERVAIMYAYALNDWDDSIVEYAVKKALLTYSFRPTPAELRKVALGLIAPQQSVMQIHGTISNFVARVHPSQRSMFMDKQIKNGQMNPIIREVVDRLGGWQSVGARASDDNYKMIEKVCNDAYDALDLDDLLASPPDRIKSIGSGDVKALASIT
jgi:hypothetical protein